MQIHQRYGNLPTDRLTKKFSKLEFGGTLQSSLFNKRHNFFCTENQTSSAFSRLKARICRNLKATFDLTENIVELVMLWMYKQKFVMVIFLTFSKPWNDAVLGHIYLKLFYSNLAKHLKRLLHQKVQMRFMRTKEYVFWRENSNFWAILNFRIWK